MAQYMHLDILNNRHLRSKIASGAYGGFRMRIAVAIQCCFISALLAGCETMLPGQIYSPTGRVLEFQIEKAHRAGAVTAYDAATGERFSGRYVGLVETVRGSNAAYVQAGSVSGVGFSNTDFSSNIANASAFMTGDKGSSLNCQMKIEAGISPHGIGSCVDAKGAQYKLQF